MNEIIPLIRKTKLPEFLEQVKKWKAEGKTKEEVFGVMDRRVLTEEDVIKIYDEGNQEDNNKTNLSDEKNIIENKNENDIEGNNELVNHLEELHTFENQNNNTGNDTEDDEEEIIEDENKVNFYLEDNDIDIDSKDNSNEEKIIENIDNVPENLSASDEYKELEDDELEDFPKQSETFKLYSDEKKKEMINSIRLNGIIQPLTVRPLPNGKYQILSGHNRRICGREAGLKYFPCIIKKDITDEEAELYFIDTNLATREKISPIERAKALLIRKRLYKSAKIRAKIENAISKDNKESIDVRKKMQEIEDMSAGNLQRYLRLNELDKELQDLVDNNTISNLKVAEQLSYLSKKDQRTIGDMIKKENIKISENQAKSLRTKENLNKEAIRDFLINKKTNQSQIVIKFTEDEAMNYFQTLEIPAIKEKIIAFFELKKEEEGNH